MLARTAASKLPAKYLTTILTALFLAATAAFGGLNDAPPQRVPEPVVVTAGEAHSTGRYTITFRGAYLADAWDGAGVYPVDGQRAVVLVADIVSNGPSSLGAAELTGTISGDAVPVDEHFGGADLSIVRADDHLFRGGRAASGVLLARVGPADQRRSGNDRPDGAHHARGGRLRRGARGAGAARRRRGRSPAARVRPCPRRRATAARPADGPAGHTGAAASGRTRAGDPTGRADAG